MIQFFCLFFISSVDRIKKKLTFALEFISQMRKGNRRTQAVDALRPLLLFQIHHNLRLHFLDILFLALSFPSMWYAVRR